MHLARSACARLEVVLEIRVAERRCLCCFQRRSTQRGTAQIGVDDHTGRVQDWPQSRRGRRVDALFDQLW